MSIKFCKLLKPKAVKNLVGTSSIQKSKVFFSSQSDNSADFGFKTVNASQKDDMVKGVFSKVAHTYDVMNDVNQKIFCTIDMSLKPFFGNM